MSETKYSALILQQPLRTSPGSNQAAQGGRSISRHFWVVVVCVAACFTCTPAFSQSARQYYDELYKVGGLDGMADAVVCFDDDAKLQTFFIFGESKTIREFMTANGTFEKLSKEFQQRLKQDFLIVRGYDKGVVVGEEDYYEKDGSSWVSDKFVLSKQPKTFGRMRLDVTWETLRYKRSVEILDSDMSLKSQVARYGKCEEVPLAVPQRGNP